MENLPENSGKSTLLPVLTIKAPGEHQTTEKTVEVACLKCEKIFQFPKHQEDYLTHLFLSHRLVIGDVDDIALLDEYLKLWRNELLQSELEEYCTTLLLDQLPDGTPSKNAKYYLLSDVLPKDYELRNKLKHESLEKVLAQHQFELTDHEFSRECLYCRDVITGLRSLYLKHLFNKHFLQLGKPENLVYIDELIAKVQDNLENLICLYCEKVFKDRVTLKEHMRKKNHKRINPNNKSYDKYFLQNYKLDENKQHTRRLNKQHKKPQTISSSERPQQRIHLNSQASESVDFEQRFAYKSEDSDSDWSEWNSDEQTLQPIFCLYCREQLPGFMQFKNHLLEQHAMNFDEVIKGLNFYQKVKVINYIRHQMRLIRCVSCNQLFETQDLLLQHLQEEQHFGIGCQKQWDKPEYFFPTYEDDGLLWILDESPYDDTDDPVVKIFSEDSIAQINKDAEKLSLENFKYL